VVAWAVGEAGGICRRRRRRREANDPCQPASARAENHVRERSEGGPTGVPSSKVQGSQHVATVVSAYAIKPCCHVSERSSPAYSAYSRALHAHVQRTGGITNKKIRKKEAKVSIFRQKHRQAVYVARR